MFLLRVGLKNVKWSGYNFLLVRDLNGLVQILVEDELEIEKLRGAQIGTIVKITGKVIEDERAPSGAEIHDPKIQIQVIVNDRKPNRDR